MSMKDDIRYLAKQHGADDLTDAQVREIQQKVAAALVDAMLDNSQLSSKPPTQTPESRHDGKA